MTDDLYDVAVVGGGPAGLSAALTLARGCRRVLLLDDDRPRNAPADRAWGLLTRDGTPPAEIRAAGRADLARYGVDVRAASVADAVLGAAGFRLTLAGDADAWASKLVLATGVEDVLPAVPGMREAWGHTVVHCPYCHGWELKGRPTAVYGGGSHDFELARMLPLWTDDVVWLTDGKADVSDEQRAELDRRGVRLDEQPVDRLEVEGNEVRAVVFADGRRLALGAFYVRPTVVQRSGLAARLGATLTESGLVEVDEVGRARGVPGLYVAGDASNHAHHLVTAAASGAEVAFALNHDLCVDEGPWPRTATPGPTA